MQFDYQVRTQQGSVEHGTIEAQSKEDAINTLQRSGYIVIDVRDQSQASMLSFSIKLFQGVPKKEVVIFSRQIATLFQAKVPLLEALKTMMEQTANATFKSALLDVAKSVDAGSSLSKALSVHKKIFSDFYVNMVKSGEASGRLEEVFGYLADGLEREFYLLQKVKGAITYPAFIITAFIGIFFVMMIWVVPNLTSVLEETGQELPFLTKVIIGVSDAFAHYWWAILTGIFSFLGGIWYFIHTPQGSVLWDTVQLKLPILGTMFRKFYLARFADTLSVLIQGGLPIVQALEITAQVVRNHVYKKILLETIEEVKKGNTISSVLKVKKDIPIMISQMVFVGEETGKLDSTLKSAADFYHKEVTVVMDNLVTLIEPILIVGLGVGVALLLVGILMPMYNMAQNF